MRRTLSVKTLRDLRELCDFVFSGSAPRILENASRCAKELDRLLSPSKPRPSTQVRRGAKKASREEWGSIRAAVFERSGDHCERCGRWCTRQALDPHHAFGGKDRRTLQSKYTVRALCRECHDLYHANPIKAADEFIAWATLWATGADDADSLGYSAAADIGRRKLRWLESKEAASISGAGR